jgi:hypothetical protein
MVEEIPAGEEVLASMYYLCEHPIVILFNSRASHDFMSLACAQKTNLSFEKTEVPYLILTPGGRVVADHMVHKITLELAGKVFPTNLLILKGQGIDIILGDEIDDDAQGSLGHLCPSSPPGLSCD